MTPGKDRKKTTSVTILLGFSGNFFDIFEGGYIYILI